MRKGDLKSGGVAGRQKEGERLLLEAAEVRPGERVLDLGCGGEAVGIEVADVAEEVCFVSSDVRHIRFCKNKIGDFKLGNVRAVLEDSLEGVSRDPFDVVVYMPPQRAAKEWVFEQIDEAFAKLRRGGRFCLAGRKDRGVESYAKRLKAVFGNGAKTGQEGRVRVYRACKEDDVSGVEPVDTVYRFEVSDLPGGPYRFEARAGVFSRDGLDPGSRYLIESLEVQPDARVLDLGCGYGAIGIVAARLATKGEVTLVDSDLRAVRSARENLRHNQIENARVEVSDGYTSLTGERFDTVVSNPPFHEGNAAAHPFIDGAAAHLSPGGQLILVAMRPEPYRRRMRQVFGRVEDMGHREGYTVIQSRKKALE